MPTNREVFETDDGQIITLAMDNDPPIANRTWAVVSMQLVDELTGNPPNGQINLQVTESGPQPRIGEDGFIGLVGIPIHLFPKLKTQPVPLHLALQVTGYLPMAFVPQVPQAPNFPFEFAPAALGKVELHTLPCVLRGRVTQISLAGAVTPVAGAVIDLTGFWPVAPTPLLNPPPSPPNMVAVFPPVYAGRTTGGGVFQRRNITAVVGQDKTLRDFAAAGSQVLALSDQVGIAPGSLLWIDPANPDRMEIMEIASLVGASTPQQPVQAALTYPLAFDHARGVVVSPATPQPPGAPKTFSRAVAAGDSTLYLNNLTGVTGTTIEVSGDGLPSEYHRLQLYSATSGADGYFRLPPVQRAAQLALRAHHPPLTNVEFNFSPEYQFWENRVDFMFRP